MQVEVERIAWVNATPLVVHVMETGPITAITCSGAPTSRVRRTSPTMSRWMCLVPAHEAATHGRDLCGTDPLGGPMTPSRRASRPLEGDGPGTLAEDSLSR